MPQITYNKYYIPKLTTGTGGSNVTIMQSGGGFASSYLAGNGIKLASSVFSFDSSSYGDFTFNGRLEVKQVAGGVLEAAFAGDHNNDYYGNLLVWGKTDTNKRMSIGFNTTGNYGYIQSYINGSGGTNLKLNPLGGEVITGGKLTVSGILDINGDTFFNGHNIDFGNGFYSYNQDDYEENFMFGGNDGMIYEYLSGTGFTIYPFTQFNGGITVTGFTTINDNFKVIYASTLADVSISGKLQLTGVALLNSDVSILGKLTVNNVAKFNDVSIFGNLSCASTYLPFIKTKEIWITNPSNIDKFKITVDASNYLLVKNSAGNNIMSLDSNGNLKVLGDITFKANVIP